MFNIHPAFLIVLVILVLIVFGPGRLPELGGAVGRTLKEFRKATSDLKDEVTRATSTDETAGPGTVQPPPTPAASTANTEPAKAEADPKKS
ncbi:MAG: twin-arginine translocase TatA/TatE family subunit [Chloroflexi bacterium]|nr:MAG: twin-arginine translocase TatA/TatE family subunit [Chloroflexota bacterium]